MSKHTNVSGVLDASGVEWTSKAVLAATGTYYSTGIRVDKSNGYSAILISTTDSITLTLEVSLDNVTFYTPYSSDKNDLGYIVSGLTADRYIVINTCLAKFIRFKMVVHANSTTTLKFIQQEES
jgi:hypothetical protein